jgi:hypothetical protein
MRGGGGPAAPFRNPTPYPGTYAWRWLVAPVLLA